MRRNMKNAHFHIKSRKQEDVYSRDRKKTEKIMLRREGRKEGRKEGREEDVLSKKRHLITKKGKEKNERKKK